MLVAFVDYIRPQIINKTFDWTMKTLAGFNPISWADLFYNLLGNLGAYDDADDCIIYMLQVESFYSHRRSLHHLAETALLLSQSSIMNGKTVDRRG